jgi:hypothetical protein
MLNNSQGKERNVEKFRQKCGGRWALRPCPTPQKLKFRCGFFEVMREKPKLDSMTDVRG